MGLHKRLSEDGRFTTSLTIRRLEIPTATELPASGS
jgi:hypothetical protein